MTEESKVVTHDIYKMKLHETYQEPDYQVMRVAGGWIYRFWDYQNRDYYHSATFVLFNNEFDTELPERTSIPSDGKITP